MPKASFCRAVNQTGSRSESPEEERPESARETPGRIAIRKNYYCPRIYFPLYMATVYYAHWILLDTGELLENGVIVVSGNSIAAVGPRSAFRRESTDRVVNLGDTLVLPGFINMHTHLEECVVRGLAPHADETFASFTAKKNNHLGEHPHDQQISSAQYNSQ